MCRHCATNGQQTPDTTTQRRIVPTQPTSNALPALPAARFKVMHTDSEGRLLHAVLNDWQTTQDYRRLLKHPSSVLVMPLKGA